jgi:hypothetical protein
MAWDELIGRVVKIRRVKISTLNDQGSEVDNKFGIMAECEGFVCLSTLETSSQALEGRMRTLNSKGLVDFLHKTACQYLDEEDIKEAKMMTEANPQIRDQIHFMLINSVQDEQRANEIEMGSPSYTDHPIGMAERVPPHLHEDRLQIEAPAYRRGM